MWRLGIGSVLRGSWSRMVDLGRLRRAGSSAHLRSLKLGEPPEKVFPIPLLRVGGDGQRPEGRAERVLANIVLCILNWLYAGSEQGARSDTCPTAAQRRVQSNMLDSARGCVRSGVPWPPNSEISQYLRYSDVYVGRGVAIRALGVRGGLPPEAADVDFAAALVGCQPELAKQILEPRSFLIPVSERPQKLKLPFIHIDDRHAELVKGCGQVGLQSRVPESRVWKHGGTVGFRNFIAFFWGRDPGVIKFV